MVLTVKCPNCEEEVSALALACPTCGFPIVLYTSMEGKVEAHDDDPLEIIAMNPHTPLVILEMLCENSSAYVRAALSENPNTPERLLLKLSDDSDDYVRIALASSPFLPIGVLEILSNDTNSEVIDMLYQNPSAPEYILRELEMQLAHSGKRGDDDFEVDEDYNSDDDYEYSSSNILMDDLGNEYYRYGDSLLPYHDGGIEYGDKFYDVMIGIESGEPMYFDEDNGWLTDLP